MSDGVGGAGGGGLRGCRVFCLFLGVWLPSLPRSGAALSRLSSALFIVYLPNEGGGTLRRLIGSAVPPCPPPPPPPQTDTHTHQDIGFLTEMICGGKGGNILTPRPPGGGPSAQEHCGRYFFFFFLFFADARSTII